MRFESSARRSSVGIEDHGRSGEKLEVSNSQLTDGGLDTASDKTEDSPRAPFWSILIAKVLRFPAAIPIPILNQQRQSSGILQDMAGWVG